jgi:transcriptional regulator with GAF, ATPase, and Fis domain
MSASSACKARAKALRSSGAKAPSLTQSVEELRALGEVTQAVSSTLDLQTLLDTIVAKATQLSSTEAGVIYVFDKPAASSSCARPTE